MSIRAYTGMSNDLCNIHTHIVARQKCIADLDYHTFGLMLALSLTHLYPSKVTPNRIEQQATGYRTTSLVKYFLIRRTGASRDDSLVLVREAIRSHLSLLSGASLGCRGVYLRVQNLSQSPSTTASTASRAHGRRVSYCVSHWPTVACHRLPLRYSAYLSSVLNGAMPIAYPGFIDYARLRERKIELVKATRAIIGQVSPPR